METLGRGDLGFALNFELVAALLLKNDCFFFDKSQDYVGFRKNRIMTWFMPLIVLK